jgi:hypothetical protein
VEEKKDEDIQKKILEGKKPLKNRKSDTRNQFSYLKISNFDNLPYSL